MESARTRPRSPFVAPPGWKPESVAALRHSTLPWPPESRSDPEVSFSLTETAGWGERDRLSLLAQIAAHLAFVRSCGVPWGRFRHEEWEVTRRRSEDGRAVRASRGEEEEESAASFLTRAAEALGLAVPETLRSGWVRPDSLYAEVDRTMRHGSASSRRWLRRAAAGNILEPGLEVLQRLASAEPLLLELTAGNGEAIRAFAMAAGVTLVEVGDSDTTPLQPLSAFSRGRFKSESQAAEWIESELGTSVGILLIEHFDRFDRSSQRVIRGVTGSRRDLTCAFVGARANDVGAADRSIVAAEPRRWFFVSTLLARGASLSQLAEAIPSAEQKKWVETFVGSAELVSFLEDGSLPPLPHQAYVIEEPRASFLAVLSLAGDALSFRAARLILDSVGCRSDPAELAIPGRVEAGPEGIRFIDAGLRAELERRIPSESKPGLLLAAAQSIRAVDPWRAFVLRVRGGDTGSLDGGLFSWEPLSAAKRTEILVAISTLADEQRQSKGVRRIEVDLLIRSGHYRTARKLAESLPDEERRVCVGRIERRTGRYAAAREELAPVAEQDALAGLLFAELCRLEGNLERAATYLETAQAIAGSPLDGAIAFETALQQIEREGAVGPEVQSRLAGDPYLVARVRTYLALAQGRLEEAALEAAAAESCSETLPERLDAALDRLFALFLAGHWSDARATARDALILVEETEGDRAAAGILFTAAWLAADAGEWARSEDLLERLRGFYTHTGDDRRLRETEMIAAHLAFSRGDYEEARTRASILTGAALNRAEREAADLVLDFIDCAEARSTEVRCRGTSGCIELTDRRNLLLARRGEADPGSILNPFLRELATWERARRAGDVLPPPSPPDRTASLQLLHAFRALERQTDLSDCRALAEELATSMGARMGARAEDLSATNLELEILRRVATLHFPLGEMDLCGLPWRYARRNRLGVWNQAGAGEALEDERLDAIAAEPERDWIRCGDEGLLFLEGVQSWTPGSQSSLAALFAMRIEHHNLKRAFEQETMLIADRPEVEVEGILSRSDSMRPVLTTIARVAERDVSVCIEGESGVGKELVARAIHRYSPRRAKPFIPLNCAALPETLVESELFGHVRGAFTGAERDQAGLIESAHGGTLFLDEIGELPAGAQAKLLRFLQDHELRRVGDSALRKADVRIVAATNRNLAAEVDAGRFREDLFYRIRGIQLRVPPLRDRGRDVILLAHHVLQEENQTHRRSIRFSDEVEAALLRWQWPGNVRELQQVVRSAHALAGTGSSIELEHLPPQIAAARGRRLLGNFFDEVVRFRRSLVERSLAECGGNQTHAARLLGISRQALAYQIRELGVVIRKEP